MRAYILKRLLLMIPTLLGVMTLNFIIVQAAPGGPVEQSIARIRGLDSDATARFSSAGANEAGGGQVNRFDKTGVKDAAGVASSTVGKYRGAQGIDPELIARLEKMYGFDKPPLTRFLDMVKHYATFDFGTSFYRDESVVNLVLEKLPVSISLGLWTTLISYLVSIPLGIRKAVKDGSAFDIWSSAAIIFGYAIPSFLFAILLVVLFAGGSFWHMFPLRGLVADNWHDLPWPARIGDYFWHLALPIAAMVTSGFATLTMLTKNSFLEEIRKQYVVTARAKGLPERRVLYGHVFRNAMLIVISGFPAAFLSILFTSALLIEVIFSLDGLGYLGFNAVVSRDYPVMFGTLYCFTLLGLLTTLIGDILYVLIDPRIDFERR